MNMFNHKEEGLIKELFEGWKQNKTQEEINEMEEKLNLINEYNEIEIKKKIIALFLGVGFNKLKYNDTRRSIIVDDKEYFVVTEQERFDDIKSCILADIGNSVLSYELLSKATKINEETLKENAVQDMFIGGMFDRDYIVEKIEKGIGFDQFVKELMESGSVPEYDFLKNEIKKDNYYIQFGL